MQAFHGKSGVQRGATNEGNGSRRLIHGLDGNDALKQSRDGDFDLMLLDMQLPKLNGADVAKQLIKSGVKIPIIGMTASTNHEDKIAALAAGCDEFLVKPIQVTSLVNTINKLLADNV